jgi:hypothetical protein
MQTIASTLLTILFFMYFLKPEPFNLKPYLSLAISDTVAQLLISGRQGNYVTKTSRWFGPGVVIGGDWTICHHDRLYRLHVLWGDGDWFKMASGRPAVFNPGGRRLPVPGGSTVAGDAKTGTGGHRQINRCGPMLPGDRHDPDVCDVARLFHRFG